jgi:hypothetical protein
VAQLRTVARGYLTLLFSALSALLAFVFRGDEPMALPPNRLKT